MVLLLVVKIVIKNAEFGPKLTERFLEYVKYVQTKEPEALTYEFHKDTTNPLVYYVAERYTRREALEVTHEGSDQFKALMAWIGEHMANVESVEKMMGSNDELGAKEEGWTPLGLEGDGYLVFCGARPGKKPAYVEQARLIGQEIARRNATLVYGGGTMGVMGAVAQAVVDAKGKIKSVIPTSMQPREVSGEMLGDVYFTGNMSDRKSLMFDMSSTVIALPGGLGTYDELLEALTLFQLNAFRPKIGLLNVEGFYEPFFGMLKHLIAEGFVEEAAIDFFVVADTAEELFKKLDAFERPPSATALTWSKKP